VLATTELDTFAFNCISKGAPLVTVVLKDENVRAEPLYCLGAPFSTQLMKSLRVSLLLSADAPTTVGVITNELTVTVEDEEVDNLAPRTTRS